VKISSEFPEKTSIRCENKRKINHTALARKDI
jgi:hypothetical protein